MSKLAGALLLVLTLLLTATVADADAAILVGTSGVRPQDDQNVAGAAEAFRTSASATGNVASLSVYVAANTTATSLRVGLYTNSNGHPGTLLTSGLKTGLTSGAVNDVSVPSTAVTSGTTYWIALLGAGGTLRFRDQANGGASEMHSVTGLSTLPTAWSSGAAYTDGNLSAYGSDAGTPQAPVLNVTPASLSFTATTGGADPAAKTASIANTGGGTLTFTTTTPGNAAWLAASPASGTAPATVSVTPHIAGLAAGTYDATVTITGAAGTTNSPQAIAVHLVVSDPTPPSTADWLQVDHDAERTGYQPGETALTPAQARTLGTAWTTAVDGKVTAQPLHVSNVTVAGAKRDVLVAVTAQASVYALDADTGTVLWRRNYGTPPSNCAIPGGFGFVAPPAMDKARGRIYAVTEGGSLITLNLADGTDAAPAQAIITNPATNRVWGGPTLVGSSTLYVSTASDGCDSPPWRGRIVKVDVSGATPAATAQWDVVPSIAPPNGGGGIWGYGGVSADTATGRVYTSTGADSVESYTLYADRLVALNANLSVLGSFEPFHPTSYPCGGDPCDVDFGSTPAVFTPTGCPTMVAAGNKNGVLYVTRTTTLAASGPAEQALQLNPANDWLGSGGIGGVPAWDPADQLLFITDVGDGEPGVAAGVVALKVDPSTCLLSVAWSRTLGGGANPNSTPTVADGVVYAGEGYSGKLFAFDAKTGEPLWSSAGPGAAFAAPIVADGMVYQGVWNGFTTAAQGTIRAFKPGATPPPPPPTTLLGTTSIGTQPDQNVAGSAEAFQATATASGTLGKLSFYLDSGSASTKVTVGVYADNGAGTHPGALLTQAATTTLTANAWNTIAVPAAGLASGTRYWVAILGTGGTLRFRDAPNGCKSEASASSALTALPATWTSGATYTDCPLSAYGTTG